MWRKSREIKKVLPGGFAGSGMKTILAFGIRDQNSGQKYGISYRKIYLIKIPIQLFQFQSQNLHTSFYIPLGHE